MKKKRRIGALLGVTLVGVFLLVSVLLGGQVAGAADTPQTPAPALPPEAAAAQTPNPTREPPNEVVVSPTTVGKRVPPKRGDICMICNKPLGEGDVVYQVRGQRVAMHRQELGADLQAQLKQLLAQLEPRGAFLGAQQGQRALSTIWFLVGVYILLGLIFAALCAHRALHAGRSPLAWFGAGLLFNVFAYFALLAARKREVLAPAGVPGGLRKIAATYAPQPCPLCGSLNHPAADACIGCGARLEPRMLSEVARVGLRPN
jgi:hypothetical protein